MKTFGEYHDLYLKCDVLLLCDVFEKFIDSCLKYYGLDPCHYFSRLRLIDDIDIHLFIERSMRGGISYIAKRYCRAKNEFFKGYDSSLEKRFITYWDVCMVLQC